MSIDHTLWLSYLFVFLFAISMACLVVALFIRFLIPKAMEQAYFREPYFSSTEIAIFNTFPFSYFKPFIFMRLAGFPGSGKKRGISEAHKLAPSWFCQMSKIFIWVFLGSGVSMIVLGNAMNFVR